MRTGRHGCDSPTVGTQAVRINQDKINVLIDLNGWTAGQNIASLAMLPAPVQVLASQPATQQPRAVDSGTLLGERERAV